MDTITDHRAREEYAKGLRHLADLIQHAGLPLPYGTGTETKEELATGPVSFYLHDPATFARTCDLLGAHVRYEDEPGEYRPDAADEVRLASLAGLHVEVRLIQTAEQAAERQAEAVSA